jgi:hypothetical protein
MKRALLLILGLITCSAFSAQLSGEFHDDFKSESLAGRRAARGPWKIGNGEAICTQDDELFKKFKSHGPILFYDLPFQNGEISFSYRPDTATRSFVFTLNAEKGHLFRFVTSSKNTALRAYVLKEGTAEHDSISVGETGPPLKPGEWTSVSVVMDGTKATVKIGEAFTTTAEHASYAKAKATISLGFSFGTVAIKDLKLVKK